MVSRFEHALSADFIARLTTEARNATWWADVLADSRLVIALRGSYLNVYWRGQSLFRVESGLSAFNVTTHEKYLLDPGLASQVRLSDRKFDISSLVERGFVSSYEGPQTIAKMKSAAGVLSGLEKTGCHEIAVRNPGIIDCEIAFPGNESVDDAVCDKSARRVDLASLETDGEDVRLVFWEAKHYSNGELRAEGGSPRVCAQVNAYERYLTENREAIERSYTKVASNFVAISEMGWKRQLSPLIFEVGTGRRRLTLGAEPKVGLIIFGFDSAQRDGVGWNTHLDRLRKSITHVRAAGNAKNLRLPI